LLDAAALAIIAFVAWKIFLAPRALNIANAHPAPHIVYSKLGGGEFRLTSERGRVVFLDFFASWCDPCRLETPLIERFARSHPNVDVVPIDVGEPAVAAARFAEQYRLPSVVLDPHSLSQGYFEIQGFPTIVVVDPEGRIRATWAGFNPAIEVAMAHAEKTLR
jgi:thiol-disulfide isomerase/thioredoxin